MQFNFLQDSPASFPPITKFDTSETYIIEGNSQKEGYILVITKFRLTGAKLIRGVATSTSCFNHQHQLDDDDDMTMMAAERRLLLLPAPPPSL